MGISKPLFDMFRSGYITGANVTQRGAGANMSVDVQVGTILIEDTDRSYPAWLDAIKNVTISAADPTNPRRDIIVAYEDKSVVSSASPNNPGALKFKSVAGTPAGSPVDPSGATIQSSVGAGNPYIQLARVAVAANAGSIVNANITDLRTPAAYAVPYLYGGASNATGHLVPNAADDTVALLNATQTVSHKTFDSTNTYANAAKFSAYKTTGQIGISTATKVSYQTEYYDTGNNYDNATNYRFTASVAGFYHFKASLYVASSTTFAALDFYKNGSLWRPGDDSNSTAGNSDVVIRNDMDIQLAATDYIEVFVRFIGGGTRSVYGKTDVAIGDSGPSVFEGHKISDT